MKSSDLDELAKEAKALDKMKRMQDGEVMNFVKPYPSENRAVLHTATRDLFDHPRTAPKAKEAAQLARQEIDKLKVFMAKDAEKKFDEMIVIGIGGSELGPRANYDALRHLAKEERKVHFLSNVDPDDAAAILKEANLKRTLVVAISKSGTTLETETNEEIVKEEFKKAGLDPRKHFVSVTMPGTPMDNRNRYYLENFYLWDWIGGRYSTTSMVGGVILAFAFGFDVFWELLKGAHAMDESALAPDLKKNLPLVAALIGIWNHNFLKYPTLGHHSLFSSAAFLSRPFAASGYGIRTANSSTKRGNLSILRQGLFYGGPGDKCPAFLFPAASSRHCDNSSADDWFSKKPMRQRFRSAWDDFSGKAIGQFICAKFSPCAGKSAG